MTIDVYRTKPHGGEEAVDKLPFPWKTKDMVTAPITVVIPSIPVRVHSLNRALKSIQRQTLQPERVIVQVDSNGEGAATTRNKALFRASQSEYVAFLDDDDYFGKDHLKILHQATVREEADYVYPWFHIAGPSIDPFPQFFGQPWSDTRPHQTTIVTLVRRELAQAVGFREVEDKTRLTPEGHTFGEDFQFTLECLERGAKIVHVPVRTWHWVVTGWNTSGQPDRWKDRTGE